MEYHRNPAYPRNKGTHVLTTAYANLLNPRTGVAPSPAFGPVPGEETSGTVPGIATERAPSLSERLPLLGELYLVALDQRRKHRRRIRCTQYAFCRSRDARFRAGFRSRDVRYVWPHGITDAGCRCGVLGSSWGRRRLRRHCQRERAHLGRFFPAAFSARPAVGIARKWYARPGALQLARTALHTTNSSSLPETAFGEASRLRKTASHR